MLWFLLRNAEPRYGESRIQCFTPYRLDGFIVASRPTWSGRWQGLRIRLTFLIDGPTPDSYEQVSTQTQHIATI